MAADPNGFDYFRRAELVPFAKGVSTTFGFDYFRRAEVVPGLIDVAAAVVTTRPQSVTKLQAVKRTSLR